MSVLESPLLDFLCDRRFARCIADIIRTATAEEYQSRDFWLRVHDQLLPETIFNDYLKIAYCHVLCVAVVPDGSDTWSEIVLDELTRRAAEDADFDAYTAGSQIGLFQAGTWLQENKQQLMGGNFLPAVAKYCTVLWGKRCVTVNESPNLSTAGKTLETAVKAYLRPDSKDLAEALKPQVHDMLIVLQQFGCTTSITGHRPIGATGADRTLFDSLIYGCLDIGHRDRREIIELGLAVTA